ncbi:hypothetical protein FOZ60_016922 [Perkinsus olseni]|uniref:Uncharacterized protein n=1 Tax=Perkinsus olseni TaxID=32597 RepID=A0A7J6P3H7_PEROL|nr:hypothetical protein FOZ60_016922 [Perkinsus olseni]
MISFRLLLVALSHSVLSAAPQGLYQGDAGAPPVDFPIEDFNFRVGKVDLLDSDLRLYTANFTYELFKVNITLKENDLKTLQERYPEKINPTTFMTILFDGSANILALAYADGLESEAPEAGSSLLTELGKELGHPHTLAH